MYEKYTKLRDALEVNDATVARETGMNATVFSDWKSGKSKPKADKLMKLAKYFGVTIEYFLSD